MLRELFEDARGPSREVQRDMEAWEIAIAERAKHRARVIILGFCGATLMAVCALGLLLLVIHEVL